MNRKQRKKQYKVILFYINKGSKVKGFFGYGYKIGFKHGRSYEEYKSVEQE